MSEVAPIRGRRPTSDESDLALIRAAIQAQGLQLAAMLGELAKLAVEVARIAEVVAPLDDAHEARGTVELLQLP